jgi:transcriptional regulator with XRE-family HTH domain
MTVKQLHDLLSRNLKALRSERGMTQDQLAEAAGISKVFLAEIETGRKYPAKGNFIKLAEALGVQPYRLIYPTVATIAPGTTEYADDIAERIQRDATELLSHYRHGKQLSATGKDEGGGNGNNKPGDR